MPVYNLVVETRRHDAPQLLDIRKAGLLSMLGWAFRSWVTNRKTNRSVDRLEHMDVVITVPESLAADVTKELSLPAEKATVVLFMPESRRTTARAVEV